jgi:SAM-dependent methyltransferase
MKEMAGVPPCRQTTLPQTAVHVPGNLEYPNCPLCDSEQRQFPFRLSSPYRVARCEACGVCYLYPRLSESAMRLAYRQLSYYEGGALGYASTSYTDQESALPATFNRLLRNLAKLDLTGGDLLEIGCGYGYFLDEARPFFRRRVGTKLSPHAAEIARTTGAEVFVGGIEQISPEATFDCVLATHVIEHVYEPLSFVMRLIRHAKPGGHIVLATPDLGGILRKFMGRHWPSFKAPEHVVYFDFQTLSLLMSRAGLNDVCRLSYPYAFPFSLIATKFGLALPPLLGQLKIWMPATTVAAYGTVLHG